MSVKKIVVLALLLTLPLPGVAASLSFLCSPAEAATTHSTHGGDRAAPERGSVADEDLSAHSFCRQLVYGMPTVPAAAAIRDFPSFAPSIFPVPSLFFPEQPQRPPIG